jgi:hypothetical protein
MSTRRVVVRNGEDKRSTIAEDVRLDATLIAGSGAFVTVMAGVDHAPEAASAAMEPPRSIFPLRDGWRMLLMTFPPSAAPRPAPGEGVVFPELVEAMRAGPGGGMHATATVDAVLVTEGRIVLEAEDGSAVELQAGDTVLQLGTMHRWRNDSAESATVAVFMAGASA